MATEQTRPLDPTLDGAPATLEEQPLRGVNALVTGAGRGIGRAVSLALAGAGADVALCSRTASQLDEVATEIFDIGREARTYASDITEDGAVDRMVDDAERSLGPLSVLVNAAGISPTYKHTHETSIEDYDAIMATNARATFVLCRAVGAHMLERRRGAITNISSIGGSVALPRLGAYCAAKGAVEALTRVLAIEWAPFGVRVNAVAPAYAPTELSNPVVTHPEIGPWLLSQTPLGRFAEPVEIAKAVVFLTSDAASYVTGVTLPVDGGWTAK